MPKLIGMFRRRPGMTPAEFRTHYEESHAPLATSLLGHLMVSYTRNYPQDNSGEYSFFTPYDVITEIVYPSDEAVQEMFAIASDPETGAALHEDERSFIDQDSRQILLVGDDVVVQTL